MPEKLVILVLCFFLLIYVTSNGGHIDIGDGGENFLVTESMALKHSAKLNPDIPTIEKATSAQKAHNNVSRWPVYGIHCCLLSAIAVPFYYLAVLFSVPRAVVVAFSNTLILSLISVVIFCFSLQIYGSKKIAFILSIVFAVCSFAWPYNSSLLPQPLQALLLIASAFFICISIRRIDSITYGISNINHKRIYFAGLGGLFLGFSIFAHPSSLIVIPGFIVYSIFSMRSSRKMLGVFLGVLAVILLFAGLVNYWRFGSFTDFGYPAPFQGLAIHSGWVGLIGLLASPGVGLIFYFPITILLPIAFRFVYNEDKRLFFLFIYVIIVFWLYFGTLSLRGLDPSTWTGISSNGWGPRYLVPILPFITIVFGAFLLHLRNRLFLKLVTIILCISGFYINLLGILECSFCESRYAFLALGLLKLDMRATATIKNINNIMTWDRSYSPIVLHQTLLSSGYVSTLPPPPDIENWTWWFGHSPCLYDNYIFCKFGIIPTLLSLTTVAIIGILILAEVSWFSPTKVAVYLKKMR